MTRIDQAYYVDRQTQEKKSRYDIIRRDLRYVLRANDRTQNLAPKARALAACYHSMLKKSKSSMIFVKHEFISTLTEVGISQNNRLHKQLLDIFDIRYYKSTTINGTKYRECFIIKFTEKADEILENPLAFYAQHFDQNLIKKWRLNSAKMEAKLCKNGELTLQKWRVNSAKMQTETTCNSYTVKAAEELEYTLDYKLDKIYDINRSNTVFYTDNVEINNNQNDEVCATTLHNTQLEFTAEPQVEKVVDLEPIVDINQALYTSELFTKSFLEKEIELIVDLCDFKKIGNNKISVSTILGFSFDDNIKSKLRNTLKGLYGDNIEIFLGRLKCKTEELEILKPSLIKLLGLDIYKSWFSQVQVRKSKNKLILFARSFIVDYIESRYLVDLQEAVRAAEVNITFYSEWGARICI